ncbi:MAG: class I SAM-dependent rRNA methyltransferase [Candidatus Binataceae bacterium]
MAVSDRARVVLRHGRDRTVRGGNPWIFSQAIERVDPSPLEPGAIVEVVDAAGVAFGYGHYNPDTTIAVRMIAAAGEPGPDRIVKHRISRAMQLRERVVTGETDCYRLVNGDGDGLPGVVIDRYGDVFVVQLLTAGADRMRDEVVVTLEELAHPRCVIERSHGAVRKREGLDDRVGPLNGDEVSEVAAVENGIRIQVDLAHGQKTGYFLDQRENRMRVRLLGAASILDAYCYAGGFTLAALAGGATRMVAIDTSARALSWARRNLALNTHEAAPVEFIHGEATAYMAQSGREFDLVVLDPPPLARSIKDVTRAGHLYMELNALAMRALKPGGYLITFSCSAHFRGEDFVRAVRFAQAKSGRNFRMLARLGAGPDHPVLLGHPEGEYLTGVMLVEL